MLHFLMHVLLCNEFHHRRLSDANRHAYRHAYHQVVWVSTMFVNVCVAFLAGAELLLSVLCKRLPAPTVCLVRDDVATPTGIDRSFSGGLVRCQSTGGVQTSIPAFCCGVQSRFLLSQGVFNWHGLPRSSPDHCQQGEGRHGSFAFCVRQCCVQRVDQIIPLDIHQPLWSISDRSFGVCLL